MEKAKLLLKEAREAIKNKDYERAMKYVQSVLKEDKYNYMALVFLGLCLQELGPVQQASKAFQKAAELNPKNPLAWNGLINYYEKIQTEEANDKLVELYISALEVETNPKKITEYSEKLSKLHERGDITKITTTIFNSASKAENSAVEIFETLAKLYETVKQIPNELQPIFEECLCKLLSLREHMKVEYFSSYLNALYQQNKYLEVFETAEKMGKLFESNTVSLIWICKIYNQTFVEESNLIEKFNDKIDEYLTKLLDLEPKNLMGLFTKSIRLFLNNKFVESRDILEEVTTLRPGLVHAWVFLTKVYLKLNQYEDALQSFSNANKLLNSGKYTNLILQKVLDNLNLQILSKSPNEEDLNKAINMYSKIEDKKVRDLHTEHIILIYINLKKFDEAKLLISDLKNVDKLKSTFLEAKLLQKQNKYKECLKLLEKNPQENSEWMLEIGLTYWYLEDYKNALIPWLKAAKYDPNNHLCFFYLGNYYKKIGDSDKTRRCYEKSFNLNKSSPQVATELCNIYCKLKNWEGAQNLLLSLIEGPINEKNCWAWSQLGLTYLEQEDYSKAIEKLQFVVRIDKENTYYWQCLADAYFARGSYTSALKCYEKSLEFTENTLYPSLQKANIKKTLGIYNEANEEFKEILLNNEQYLPALKGLSETCICQAWECYRDQRLGTARDHAQSALKHLTLAVKERNNFSCLWKLIGDACLFVTNLPEKYCCLFVTDTLMEGKRIIEREDLFALATSSYCKAIGLTEDNVLIWHDLSNCYLKHALHTEDKEKRSMLFAYATAAAKHCSASNPKNWQHWNLLGNIVMPQDERNLALAQHYFIKAVTVENNNPISWCNLGILYLLMGDIKLANKAFAQGQRSDPNYVNNWIGQALIAETMGVEEAMDLFRHRYIIKNYIFINRLLQINIIRLAIFDFAIFSVQLGHHQQGAIGYGHWVCQTLLEAPKKTISYSIEGMHAIPVACDALTWYTEKEEDNGCAWNMLGILKERMKLNKGK